VDKSSPASERASSPSKKRKRSRREEKSKKKGGGKEAVDRKAKVRANRHPGEKGKKLCSTTGNDPGGTSNQKPEQLVRRSHQKGRERRPRRGKKKGSGVRKKKQRRRQPYPQTPSLIRQGERPDFAGSTANVKKRSRKSPFFHRKRVDEARNEGKEGCPPFPRTEGKVYETVGEKNAHEPNRRGGILDGGKRRKKKATSSSFVKMGGKENQTWLIEKKNATAADFRILARKKGAGKPHEDMLSLRAAMKPCQKGEGAGLIAKRQTASFPPGKEPSARKRKGLFVLSPPFKKDPKKQKRTLFVSFKKREPPLSPPSSTFHVKGK